MRFYITDAFSGEIFGGNPAGVVILDEGRDFPKDDIMIKTAAELRYSETAFIKPMGSGRFRIRYFTPTAEVELCGHATIGSFRALMHGGYVRAGDECTAVTAAGEIGVSVGDELIFMDMAAPERIIDAEKKLDPEELYSIMGMDLAKLTAKGLAANAQVISTGLPDIMMPVYDTADLNAIEPDFSALAELSRRLGVVGVHAFTTENVPREDSHTRNFAPLFGIDEEAATGTASGALTWYLIINSLADKNAQLRFIQGEKLGRPSAIYTKADTDNDRARIRVGGMSAVVACGEIFI